MDVKYDEEVLFTKDGVDSLYGISGVYFMFDDKDLLLYIGRANNLTNRLRTYLGTTSHLHVIDRKSIRTIRVIKAPKDELKEMEKYFILKFLPPFNYAGTKGMSERCLTKNKKKTITVNIDKELLEYISALAKEEGRSLSQQISHLVKKGKVIKDC